MSTSCKKMLCYLGAGSNLGDRLKNIKEAVVLLKETKGIKVLRSSPVYETQPQGGPGDQGDFLNLVLEIECALSPAELLLELKRIEKKAGRREGAARWSARELDLDILICGDLVLKEKDLTVPHPLMHERSFVLKPLADLAPRLRHPVLQRDIETLLKSLKEKKTWRKIEETIPVD